MKLKSNCNSHRILLDDHFAKSFNMYQRANGNPFATPVQVYSNVNNGMGIFAGGTLTSWDVGF